jgi:signal transduction histidine kinase
MLHIYLLIACILFNNLSTVAQKALSQDSVHYYIKNLPKNGTLQVNTLYRMSAAYLSINVDSSKMFADEAMVLAEKNRYDSGYFLGLKYKADALLAIGKIDAVYELGNDALFYADKINRQEYKGYAYFTMAIAKQYQYQIPVALNLYTKSIPFFEETNNRKNLSRVYQNVASLLYEKKAFAKGLTYAQKAIAINEELHDTIQILTCKVAYGNLLYGSLYLLEANGIYKTVLNDKNFNKLNTIHQYIMLHNIGALYFDLKKYDSSLYYFELATTIKNKYQLEFFALQHLSKTASAYIQLGNFKKAQTLLSQAEKYVDSETDLSDYLEAWSEYYTSNKDFEKATKYLNHLIEYKDSLNSVEVKIAFTEMDSLLNDNEKQRLINERDIKIKTLEINSLNKSKRITFLSFGTLILFISSLLGYLFYRKKQQLKNKDIVFLKKENEFIAIKSSLEGQIQERTRISKEIHDELGSSLTSISLLTEVLKKRLDSNSNPEVNKISDTSADMVDKMNEIIWALNTSNDTANSLVAYVRKFANNFLQDANIELEFSEKEMDIYKPLEGTVRRNIYLTIKEAINNIVKHSNAKKVTMLVNMADGLQIEIKDDGKGIDFETLPQFRNGLGNMKKRMEDIGGKFTIENNNGTLIKLTY